jgi:hypothetical protein
MLSALVLLLAWLLGPAVARGQADTTYRIVSSRYHLELLPADRAVRGVDTIGLRLHRSAGERVALRMFPLYRVTGVSVNGRSAEFDVAGDRLSFALGGRRDSATVVVEYAGRFTVGSEFAMIGPERAVFHEEGAMPTGPYDLSLVRGSITVPRGWSAVAAGSLVDRRESNDSVTFVWEERERLSNVGWICAGSYERTDESTQERTGPLLVSTYLDTTDSARAGEIRAQVRDILRFYSSWFTPYRFSKLAVVEVDNLVAGRNVLAIASPSMILVKRVAFETKDVFNQVASVLPHEVAHQWWPMTVFIEDEDAAFLSEGMCEYSALVYAESSGKMTGRDSLSHHPLLRLLLARVAKGEDQPLRMKADLRSLPTHYLKASYVHNMVRELLGDSLFHLLYAAYSSRFALRTASLGDYQALAESLAGRPLGWFFRQWVTGKGIPRMKIYNVKCAADSAGRGWRTRGRVRLVGYEKFTAGVRVGTEGEEGARSSVAVWLGDDPAGGPYRNDVPFEIRTEARPARVVLDPGGEILKLQRIPVKISQLRDQADGLMVVGTGPGRESLARRAQKDSASMSLNGWSVAIRADSSITLADLQREYVFLYGAAGENSVARDLAGKFPYRPDGDSVTIGAETLRDSTMSLVQAVENPYQSSGVLTWVAPLGPSASGDLLPYDDSWVLLRGNDVVARGVWEVTDDDLVVTLPADGGPKK